VEKEEVQRLLNLRSYLIEKYEGLSGATHATTENRKIAEMLEKAVKDVDKLLETYVNFD
jgi:hypothetical protein